MVVAVADPNLGSDQASDPRNLRMLVSVLVWESSRRSAMTFQVFWLIPAIVKCIGVEPETTASAWFIAIGNEPARIYIEA